MLIQVLARRIRRLSRLAVAMVAIACCAAAPFKGPQLDSTDAGVYGLIHRDGHLTDMRYRLAKGPERWMLEDRRADGSWENITCEKDCLLQESTLADIESWMGKLPEGASARCVHNTAFAFCRLMRAGLEERRYVMLALITGQPIPMWLLRMETPGDEAAR